MGRVIQTENVSTERTRLKKGIVIALRELLQQKEVDDFSRDLTAFILLSLERITETVESSMQAWEKRGYWLKADQFRMEWDWAQMLADRIRPHVLSQDYVKLIPDLVAVGQALNDVAVSPNHRLGTPWVGAWNALQKKYAK